MSKKFPKPTRFTPKNPDKYEGDVTNIISRSSWEFRFKCWLDTNPQVLKWASETTIIPYVSPVDNKYHRYYCDYKISVKDNAGKVETYLVEIKPDIQTRPPVERKKTKRYLTEVMTYGVNSAKWNAATQYAADRGMKFIIVTEKHLGI